MTKILDLQHFKKLAKGGGNFVLLLNGGLRSSKYIEWANDKFYVFNDIDDSEQELTEEQIMDKDYTNIGEGIQKGAFYCEK